MPPDPQYVSRNSSVAIELGPGSIDPPLTPDLPVADETAGVPLVAAPTPDRSSPWEPAIEPQAPPASEPVAPPAPADWADVLTETDGPRMWDRLIRAEQARNVRHRRTATIVLVDVDGFPDAAARWGRELALQLLVRLARVLSDGVRASDHMARIAPTRFGIMLTETDEVRAINFVDRVTAQCEAAVDPDSDGLRVVFGWASPEIGGRLADARRVAEERLEEARRRLG